jgi:hypothetical protein
MPDADDGREPVLAIGEHAVLAELHCVARERPPVLDSMSRRKGRDVGLPQLPVAGVVLQPLLGGLRVDDLGLDLRRR